MKVNIHPKEGMMFNAFLVMFFVHKVQTGVGFVGLPRIVFLDAGHDAWISVLLAGIGTSIVIWLMTLMLKQYDSADLYGIQVDMFGKWVGTLFNLLYMVYLSASFFTILMNYIEIVQVWIFPALPTWQLALILILLSLYAVHGGLRVIIGFAFLAVAGTLWLIFMIFVPIEYADPTHLFPILDLDKIHLMKGMYRTSLSLMGFELLLFIYPFVKEKTKVLRFAQIGNLYTTFIFTIVTIVSIVFFGEMSLKQIIWPIFSMFKIVHLPNLERFEFIAVSIWMLMILPNMCAYLWAASQGFSRILVKKQKYGMWLVAILTWGGTFFVQTRYQMNQVTDYVAKAGFICAYCYPLLLSALVLVKKWLIRRRKTHAQES